jgi:hypothetical protein
MGNVVWNQYVASYASAYSLTLLVIAGFALLTAILVFVGLRKNVRYTAEAPVVDMAASVFEQPAVIIEDFEGLSLAQENRSGATLE